MVCHQRLHVFTGDTEQLTSVGAGGMLALLVTDNGAFELEQVHRFVNEWERGASVRLRAGDTGVLDLYEDHARIAGAAPSRWPPRRCAPGSPTK